MSSQHRRVALVTGSANWIGRGIAEMLADSCFDLALNGDVRAAQDADFLAALKRRGSKIHDCPGDASRPDQRQAIVDSVRAVFGRLDVYVNNVVVAPSAWANILDITEQDFDSLLDVNLKGPYFLTQHIARWMIEQHASDPSFRGVIIYVVSSNVTNVLDNHREHCFCKTGLSMATQLWAHRLGDSGIAVYEVRPGLIRPDSSGTEAQDYDPSIAERLTVEKRWGLPEDVGRAVAMLARGELTYATGNVIKIDGGLTLRRL